VYPRPPFPFTVEMMNKNWAEEYFFLIGCYFSQPDLGFKKQFRFFFYKKRTIIDVPGTQARLAKSSLKYKK